MNQKQNLKNYLNTPAINIFIFVLNLDQSVEIYLVCSLCVNAIHSQFLNNISKQITADTKVSTRNL